VDIGGVNMKIKNLPLSQIKVYENNPRHNDQAVEYVMNSIKEFGFKQPLVIDADGVIVAGHTRYKAAIKLKLKDVPCVIADDLTAEQIAAYRLADNKTSEYSVWDIDLLDSELDNILDIDMKDFGFFRFTEDDAADEHEDFEDIGEKKKITCPHCGEEFYQ